MMQRLLKNQRFGFVVVIAAALATRLLGIASRPLWYDEAFSVLFAEKGPGSMLVGTLSSTATASAEEHPLAYYTFLWGWMRAFGESPIAVRMLSVIAGLVLAATIYWLAYELFNPRAALAAGVVIALSPFQIHYAQEIRMYVFMSMWLLLATLAYWRATQSKERKWWAWFAIFAALAQYTHSLSAFYLIALALWPLINKNWKVVKEVTLAGLLAILLYLPWLIHLPAQFAKVGQAYWIEKPGLYKLFTMLLVFVTNLPLPDSWLMAGLFTSLLVVAIALWQTLRAARHKQTDIQLALWMLYLSFAPPLLLFLFSQWKPVYLERALLPSGAILCIWLAWALTETRLPRLLQIIMAILLLAAFGMGIYQHVTYAGFPYGPYKSLANDLQAKQQPGDVIIHSSKLSMLPSVYYDRTLSQTYIADPLGSNVDTLAPATQQVLGLEAESNIASAAGNAQRVWFIIFDQSNQEYIQAGYPEHPHLTWLKQNYSQVEVENQGDLRVYMFSKNP